MTGANAATFKFGIGFLLWLLILMAVARSRRAADILVDIKNTSSLTRERLRVTSLDTVGIRLRAGGRIVPPAFLCSPVILRL